MQLFEILSNCPSAVVREGYFEEAVEITGVSRSAAYSDFRAFIASKAPARSQTGQEKSMPSRLVRTETLTNLEGDLLWIVLKKLEWADTLEQVIDQKWIRSNTCEGRILSLILGQATVDHIEKANEIYFLLETDEERDCFNHYAQDSRSIPDMADFVVHTITAMIHRYFKIQIEAIDQSIENPDQPTTDRSKFRELLIRKRDLIRERDSLCKELSREMILNS
jgi:hypothetical protein